MHSLLKATLHVSHPICNMGQDNINRTDSIFTIAGLSPDVIEERVMKKTYGVSVASRAIPEVGTAL